MNRRGPHGITIIYPPHRCLQGGVVTHVFARCSASFSPWRSDPSGKLRLTMSFFGSSFGSPNVCPHCRSQVDLTNYGTVSAHISRSTGSPCSGAGLPATAVPPWPGTLASVKAPAAPRKIRRRRALRRPERRVEAPAAL